MLLAACSSTRLAYDNADWLLRWRATSFLDVHGEQSSRLDAHIATFLAWHRSNALPHYARLADDAAARVARGLSREDLVWGYDSLLAQLRVDVRRAAGEIAGLLDTLSAEQIAHLEQRIGEDNREFAEENLAGTPQKRRDARLRRNVERLEDWLGTLTDAQMERVRRYSERAPLTDELRDRDRRRRQADLLAMVRKREAGARLADWAAGWDRGRDAGYDAAARRNVEEFLDMLLDIERTMTPEQRLAVVARFRGLAEDFAKLAARGAAQSVSR
jgi:hypothetical protein